MNELALDSTGQQQLDGVVRVSATDGFSAYIAAPAGAAVRRRHPRVSVEIVSRPERRRRYARGSTSRLLSANLKFTAPRPSIWPTTRWVCTPPESIYVRMQCESAEELAEHSLVYFIDSMLQVDELDLARKLTVSMREAVTSTNVFVHIEQRARVPASACSPASWPSSTTI